jgi:hypothetical protein
MKIAYSLKVQRIILLSLIAGPSAFMGFVLLQRAPKPEGEMRLSLIAAGAAAIEVVAAIIVPSLMAAQQRRSMASGQASLSMPAGGDEVLWLLGGMQTRAIIRAALLEGAAFFNIFAYMEERQPFSLAVAIVVLLGIAITIPFRQSTEDWVERELRDLRDAREFRH